MFTAGLGHQVELGPGLGRSGAVWPWGGGFPSDQASLRVAVRITRNITGSWVSWPLLSVTNIPQG